MNPPGRRQCLWLALILFASAFFHFSIINRRFDRDAEGCGAFFGLLARNYFRYPLNVSHGLPVMSMGQGAIPPIFYANHPPTTPLLIAAVNAITGYRGGYDTLPGDWQVRLPTVLFTLACTALIYGLVKRRQCARAGLIAAAIFSFIPMTLTFGGLPDVINPQLLFFILLTVAVYEKLSDQPNGKNLAMLILAFTGAGIMDWPAFFLGPVLAVHFVLTHKPKQWIWIISFGAFAGALFAALYLHASIGQPGWDWMLRQVQHRTSSTSDREGAFTIGDWLKNAIWDKAIARHTLIVCVLGAAWLGMALVRRFRGPADRMTALLLAWAALHVAIGRQGVYQHEWWWWPLTPGLVMAAALTVEEILSRSSGSATVSRSIVAISILVFASWNIRGWVIERRNIPAVATGALNYSLADWGEVIRENTPADAAVLVAEDDLSMAFWHYADRAVIRHVWDLPAFERRKSEGWVDVTFDYYEKWPGKVSTMIVPKAFLSSVKQPLINYLDQHYPRHETAKFVVWNLSL